MDIDIVVLWVDGSDPAWLAEKNRYSPQKIDDSNSASRFRDWGLMPYWFRAIEAYAPWVRTIHFVTWGHLPPFLNTEHPKLHIVRHGDYIPGEWLPTFSANPLEMNIHRIPGLAEHFIYFNDDTFLLRPMREEDFFRGGLPCAQATELPLGFVGQTQVWQFLAANDLGILNKWFNKRSAERAARGKFLSPRYHWYDNLRTLALRFLFPDYFLGFKSFHCPAPFLKSSFEELWEKEPELLALTSSHRFRSREDVNQWLALWWQLASGRFMPRRIDALHCAAQEDTVERLCEVIRDQRHEMLCISDPSGELDFEALSSRIRSAFETILPEKCSFEK